MGFRRLNVRLNHCAHRAASVRQAVFVLADKLGSGDNDDAEVILQALNVRRFLTRADLDHCRLFVQLLRSEVILVRVLLRAGSCSFAVKCADHRIFLAEQVPIPEYGEC